MWITQTVAGCMLHILLVLIQDCLTLPNLDYIDQDNYVGHENTVAQFLTLGQKYSIAIGGSVVLPCKVEKTKSSGEEIVLAWKRGIAVLTASTVKVTMNPRIRLMPSPTHSETVASTQSGYNLEIRDVRKIDAGQYACQMGTQVPKEIIHTLEVLEPPKIDFVSPPNRLDVSKGSPVRLECKASGNPQPLISWSRKNNMMPTGEPNVTKQVLEILHANRHTAGHYRCTADNRVGQADSREIVVNVLYPPEIEDERSFIHTGVGYEAILSCVVHAEPPPNVIWYKDTTQIGTTEQHSQQIRGNKYTLTIRNVTYADFGNYSCRASNNLGKDRHTLVLSGLPAVCTFDSPIVSHFRDQYNISWSVQSHAPIREYRLFYKKQSHKSHAPHQDLIDNNILAAHSAHVFTPYNAQLATDQWENVVIPEIHYDYDHNQMTNRHNAQHNIRYHMNFLIRNLTFGTNYEARVQARNDHGWNKLSSTFHFSTRSEEYSVSPAMELELAYGKLSSSTSSGNQIADLSLGQYGLIIICMLYKRFVETS